MSLNEKKKKFKSLEAEIYKIVCQLGCDVLGEILERTDEELMKQRDRKVYRHKGKRKRTIKTVMGEVEYRRNLYESQPISGEKAYIYLLDEELGMDTIGSISMLMAEKIAHRIMQESYRETARTISECTGQSISHMGVWNLVMKLGEKLKQDARNEEKRCFEEKEVVPVLFEEQDGIYLNMQKKDRGKGSKSKREMKAAVVYKGITKTGTNRQNVVGKVAYASFEPSQKFVQSREQYFGKKYDLDEVNVRLVNGDGASWIKQTVKKIQKQAGGPEVQYQLDPFHRNKKVRECVIDRKNQKVVFNYLEKQEIEEMMLFLGGILPLMESEKEQEKLSELIGYFEQNREGLIPWKEREIPGIGTEARQVEYGTMGTMEANMGTIAIRMKKRRASWTKNGAENLAQLLCAGMSGMLGRMIEQYAVMALPETLCEPVIEGLTAAEACRLVGRGNDYPVKSRTPFSDACLNPERKAIRDLVGMRIL